MTQGVNAAVRQAAGAKERGDVVRLGQFLRAWRALFGQVFSRARALNKARAEGRLGEDYEGFLDDLMGTGVEGKGIDEQVSNDAIDSDTITETGSRGAIDLATFSLGAGNEKSVESTYERGRTTERNHALLRPSDWEVVRNDVDARGIQKDGQGILREVYGRFPTEGHDPQEVRDWTEAAGAELALVAKGNKPLFHEDYFGTPEGTAAAADALKAVLPAYVVVGSTGTHLFAYDREAVQKVMSSDPAFYGTNVDAAVHSAIESGEMGELLGYGSRNIMSGDARASFYKSDKTAIIHGFRGHSETIDEIAVRRAQTLSEALGYPVGERVQKSGTSSNSTASGTSGERTVEKFDRNPISDAIDAAPIRGTGRHGGIKLTEKLLDAVERRHAELTPEGEETWKLHRHADAYLTSIGKRVIFRPYTGEIFLRSDSTYFDYFHEQCHARQRAELGLERYLAQRRYERELHVFEEIMRNASRFTKEELEVAWKDILHYHAICGPGTAPYLAGQ